MRAPARAAALAAVALLAGGCTGSQEPQVRSTAQAFAAAVAAGDGAAACRLLAPLTRTSLEGQGEQACDRAVLAEDLPRVSRATTVHRYGREGMAVLSGDGGTHDTYFLAEFGTRWLVSAAGCTGRGDLPYDCDVEGP